MRKGEPMGVCKALTITKILFWSGMGLMLLSLAIMSIADDAGAWTQGLAFLGLLVCFGGIGFGFCKVRCPYCGKSLMAGGRIPGASRFGRSWAIPENAEKPSDPRFQKQRRDSGRTST